MTAIVPGKDAYLEYMRAKRDLVVKIGTMRVNLADAEMQHELLDLDQQIARATAPMPEFHGRGFNVEDLARASSRCEQLEAQIEQLTAFSEDDHFGKAMAPVIQTMIRPMLDQQLDQAQQLRDAIQHELEKEPEAQA